ncbi:MAG: HNH endonuclease signature motif containing protein [Desulfatiglandales bacterium]
MAKKRRKIPNSVEAKILVANRHLCCICHEEGKNVHIHHIDGNPSNNDPENLCVLCLHHHDKVHSKSGLGKTIKADHLKIYKREWEDRCKVEDKKKTVINNFYIYIKKIPEIRDLEPFHNFVKVVTSSATLDQIYTSVEASASNLRESTGDELLAEDFKTAVLLDEDNEPEK